MSVVTSTATIVRGSASGVDGGGAIALPGVNVGDVLFAVEPAGFIPGFEQTVSAADQIQQISTMNWGGLSFTFYLLRGV